METIKSSFYQKKKCFKYASGYIDPYDIEGRLKEIFVLVIMLASYNFIRHVFANYYLNSINLPATFTFLYRKRIESSDFAWPTYAHVDWLCLSYCGSTCICMYPLCRFAQALPHKSHCPRITLSLFRQRNITYNGRLLAGLRFFGDQITVFLSKWIRYFAYPLQTACLQVGVVRNWREHETLEWLLVNLLLVTVKIIYSNLQIYC